MQQVALDTIDWVFIGIFLLLTAFIAIRYSSRAGESLGEFFLSGRKLPWYIAGFSMVATTFAADTPLAVTEIVKKQGIAGNWFWWNMMIGGMLTTFFFARMWRRANIMTDVELIEIRYGGKAAAFLRGFKAIYIGLFLNTLIIGWVNLALASILKVFFNIPDDIILYYVGGAMLFTALYSSLSGLWGVAITDFIQFIIAMTGCIVLAIVVVNTEEVGGIAGMKEKLPPGSLNFFPAIGDGGGAAGSLSIGIATFFAFIGVQWWSSWYPGAEPGGGGYVAQRMMSAKDEKNSLWATLFFTVAHYCLRPWPWIIVGLCTIIMYPELQGDNMREGYVMAMRDHLPAGLKGLLLVTFLAAYMSTIATQLNWGASYFINDLYKRFIKKEEEFTDIPASEKHYVAASRIFTLVAMAIALGVTTQMHSISAVWGFIIECGAGLGLVLILRWYWWRINVWSEISATLLPFIGYSISHFYYGWSFPDDPESLFLTVGITTVGWLTITFFTQPESQDTLKNFYLRVQPQGAWEPVKARLNLPKQTSTMPWLFLSWISAIIMTYCLLFCIGKVILLEGTQALILGAIATVGFLLMRWGMSRAKLL